MISLILISTEQRLSMRISKYTEHKDKTHESGEKTNKNSKW